MSLFDSTSQNAIFLYIAQKLNYKIIAPKIVYLCYNTFSRLLNMLYKKERYY